MQPFPDGSIADEDHDGLCDALEVMVGTDPGSDDTDGDGFSDWFEYVNRMGPLRSDIPERDIFIPMVETPEASVSRTFTLEVRASGEDFAGHFAAFDAGDPLGITAADFITGIEADFADPPENVGMVFGEMGVFGGVTRRTVLGFELGMAYGDQPPRRCIRAFPFEVIIKSSLGRTYLREDRYLLILPVGETTRTGTWCMPTEVLCT